MKDVAGRGTEPRVNFSEMREGARKQGEADWADGVRVSAYIFLTGDHFHPPTQCYTSAVQRAKRVPELSRKARIVSRVSANVRRKQRRHQTAAVQQLHPGMEPAQVFDALGSCKAASNRLCSVRCPLPTDLPHEAERRVQTLSVSASLL